MEGYLSGVRPKCPKGCVKCCLRTEMIITPSDIRRLEMLGFKKNKFATYDGKFWRLKNVSNKCVFLDEKQKICKVYEHRPLGCRAYPVIYLIGEGFTIDRECPAYKTLTADDLVKGMKLIIRILSEYGIFI